MGHHMLGCRLPLLVQILFLHLGQGRTGGKQPTSWIQTHKFGHWLTHKVQSKLRLLLQPLRSTKPEMGVSRFCSHQQGKSQACPQTFGLSPLAIKWNSTWILASQWGPVSNLSAHWWGHWSLFQFRSWNTWQESAQCLLCNYSPPTTFGNPVYEGKSTLTTKTFQRMITLSYL